MMMAINSNSMDSESQLLSLMNYAIQKINFPPSTKK